MLLYSGRWVYREGEGEAGHGRRREGALYCQHFGKGRGGGGGRAEYQDVELYGKRRTAKTIQDTARTGW